MNNVKCKLFVIARIAGLTSRINLDLDKRSTVSLGRSEPNHLLMPIYKQGAMLYELLHQGSWKTPFVIDVPARPGQLPTVAALRKAAQVELRKQFSSMSLESTAASRSYWTGTYWFVPKADQVAAGFRVLDATNKPIRGQIDAIASDGSPSKLEMDVLVQVQKA